MQTLLANTEQSFRSRIWYLWLFWGLLDATKQGGRALWWLTWKINESAEVNVSFLSLSLNVFFLTVIDCHQGLFITATFNTTFELIWNGACSSGTALWAIQSRTTRVVAAHRRWRWLLARSGPWHSGPITASEKKHRQSPSLPEECDAICSQVWLIPAEQSRPHHKNERRQEITKGARMSLFHTASCFHSQIILNFFLSLGVCVLPKCCFSRFLSVCKGTPQGPFPSSRQIRGFFCLWSRGGLQRKSSGTL